MVLSKNIQVFSQILSLLLQSEPQSPRWPSARPSLACCHIPAPASHAASLWRRWPNPSHTSHLSSLWGHITTPDRGSSLLLKALVIMLVVLGNPVYSPYLKMHYLNYICKVPFAL